MQVLPSGHPSINRAERIHHPIRGNDEALRETTTAREDELRLPRGRERRLELGIHLCKRRPLINPTTVAEHHDHDRASRAELAHTRLSVAAAHLQDAVRRPVDGIDRRRGAAHGGAAAQYSTTFPPLSA